jgi:hypothetical protein
VQRDLDYVFGRDTNHVLLLTICFYVEKDRSHILRPRGCFDCGELFKILLNPCYTNVRRYSVTHFIFYGLVICIYYDKNICHACFICLMRYYKLVQQPLPIMYKNKKI